MSLQDYGLEQGDSGRQHQWLGKPKMSHYIPAWYVPHTDLDVPVSHKGEPQGMYIRNVLPFRRWAVNEHGETLPQSDFAEAYLRYLEAFGIAEHGQFSLEAIPNVKNFVRAKLDHNGNMVDFAFNDDGAVIKAEKFTQDGDIAPEFLAREQARAEESGGMRTLMKLMREGKLSSADFAKQAAEIMGEEIIEAPAAVTKTPKPKGKPLSEEAKAKLRDNLAKAREARAAKAAAAAEAPPPNEAA